ncbi:MurR/RpiR family transcriptional regulator [Rubellimicrobium arenae]|uniref:MurR/RpiR family transcriptional regulator n=1 Tax=Rubellimicrobium arenae TaxID=2817372 RepID=UPI001FEDD78A|nr:MurR/RpiR family transcriptional regulator [Rubellimicrobium arenae]
MREAASLRTRLDQLIPTFTAGERRISQAILADYPYGGLVPIQELANRAGVSAPTITRFVAKIGCAGYQDFQRQLIGELKERELSPVQLKREGGEGDGAHFLPGYASRVAAVVQQTAASINPQQFDDFCRMLADRGRGLHLIGGRVTDSIAQLLSVHLRQIRTRVHHLPADPEQWPDIVLGLQKRDVVIVFDIRRYDPRLADLARLVASRGATVVAVTDKWLSPVTVHAKSSFSVPTDVGTPWDTHVALVTFVEAVITRVSEVDWAATSSRIAEVDSLRAVFSPRPAET